MPRINGTSDTQSSFLRSFIKNPSGPPPDAWPSPVILRRWLKKPSFRLALSQVQDAYRHQADLHLSAAACRAAAALQDAFSDLSSSIENQQSKIENSLALLRLHHVRLRFPLPDPATAAPPPAEFGDNFHFQGDPELAKELDRIHERDRIALAEGRLINGRIIPRPEPLDCPSTPASNNGPLTTDHKRQTTNVLSP